MKNIRSLAVVPLMSVQLLFGCSVFVGSFTFNATAPFTLTVAALGYMPKAGSEVKLIVTLGKAGQTDRFLFFDTLHHRSHSFLL